MDDGGDPTVTARRTGTILTLAALAWAGAPGCASGPPAEVGDFREPELVELTALDPTIRLDIRYSTSDNFLGRRVYDEARAFLERPAAEALARVQEALRKEGCTLIVHDGYRPWRVTKLFWDITPPEDRRFVADPSKGSKHNRGCAVDLTLGDLATGKPLPMPSAYDEFSERAHPGYAGGTEEERRNRDRLRAAMEREGFAVYEHEWWHFDHRDWPRYRVLDVPFSSIGPSDASGASGASGPASGR
ncbi:MAG: M15 family metallopeptidase [Planctomycetes bacterium]|nr:M15 family metallopeptidase [Planctomycetota bacterium]